MAFGFRSGRNFPYVSIPQTLYTMAEGEVLFSGHHILLFMERNLYPHQSLAFETIISQCIKNHSLKLRAEQ